MKRTWHGRKKKKLLKVEAITRVNCGLGFLLDPFFTEEAPQFLGCNPSNRKADSFKGWKDQIVSSYGRVINWCHLIVSIKGLSALLCNRNWMSSRLVLWAYLRSDCNLLPNYKEDLTLWKQSTHLGVTKIVVGWGGADYMTKAFGPSLLTDLLFPIVCILAQIVCVQHRSMRWW